MPRTWTPEQRAAAAERIRQTKPWKKSTGPRTLTGKASSRMNALKYGKRSVAVIAERRAVMQYLRSQQAFLKQVRLLLRLQRQIKKNPKTTNELIKHPAMPGFPQDSAPVVNLFVPCKKEMPEKIKKPTIALVTGKDLLNCPIRLISRARRPIPTVRSKHEVTRQDQIGTRNLDAG